MARRPPKLWRRWRADDSGVAMLEFALVMPVLLLLYVGGFETSQAIATYRKVADTTVEMANVTAQYSSMSSTDVSSVMSAASQIMAPYSTTNLSIVISEISTDANNNATVTWSVPSAGATALPSGQYTLPAGMASPSTSYMLIQTAYTYVPTVGVPFIGNNIPMSDQIYMQPRNSASIPYTG